MYNENQQLKSRLAIALSIGSTHLLDSIKFESEGNMEECEKSMTMYKTNLAFWMENGLNQKEKDFILSTTISLIPVEIKKQEVLPIKYWMEEKPTISVAETLVRKMRLRAKNHCIPMAIVNASRVKAFL